MIAVLSDRIATFIRANDPKTASKEVLVYGISTFLHSFLTLLSIFAVCFITGRLAEGAVAIGSFIVLRLFAGGAHLQSSWKCDIVSTIGMLAIAHIEFPYSAAVWIMNSVAFVLVAILAPQKPNLTYRLVAKNKDKLKWISLIIVASNIFIQSPYMANAFLLLSLSLTKPFYWFFSLIERR